MEPEMDAVTHCLRGERRARGAVAEECGIGGGFQTRGETEGINRNGQHHCHRHLRRHQPAAAMKVLHFRTALTSRPFFLMPWSEPSPFDSHLWLHLHPVFFPLLLMVPMAPQC